MDNNTMIGKQSWYNNSADAELKTALLSCRHFVAYYTKPWLEK